LLVPGSTRVTLQLVRACCSPFPSVPMGRKPFLNAPPGTKVTGLLSIVPPGLPLRGKNRLNHPENGCSFLFGTFWHCSPVPRRPAFRLGKPRVVPILIDLEAAELKAPLGSFQTVRCDREGLFAMFETINHQAEPPLSQDSLRRSFERWWPEIEGALGKFQASPPSTPRRRDPNEVLDEILLGVRQLMRDREQGARGRILRALSRMGVQVIWDEILAEARSKYPSLATGLELAVPLGAENGVLRLAFPEEDKLTMESLMRANNRSVIEALVSGMLGAPYQLEVEVIAPFR
jgi:hypothetical protein